MIKIHLEDCINFLLTTAQHKVFIIMKKNLEKYDVTPIQYAVLNCISSLEFHNTKDIASYLSLENSTMSGVIDRMEKKDLLRKEIDANDRRYITIYLTKKSEEMISDIFKTVEDVNTEILSMFNDSEKKDLKRFLKRLGTL